MAEVRVLIADDDAGSRLVLAAALQRLGHECIVTEDGEAAWRRYQETEPEVGITDWHMPGMDGTALAGHIRGALTAPYSYVLVLTGAADEHAARATMQAGADDVVAKPLDVADLERKLIAAERVTRMHRSLHAD